MTEKFESPSLEKNLSEEEAREDRIQQGVRALRKGTPILKEGASPRAGGKLRLSKGEYFEALRRYKKEQEQSSQ